MRNVAPSRALERRARSLLQVAFFTAAAGVFFVFVGIALTAVPLAAPSSSSYGLYNFIRNAAFIVGVLAAISGILMGIRAITWRPDNDLAKITGATISHYLDDRYTFIRNVSKLSLGYIDAVLVGPPGVLVFRIVDHSGVYLNEIDRWLKMNPRDRKWIPAGIDPTREAVTDIKNLQVFLAKRGLAADLPIFGVVVFIKDPPMLQLSQKDGVLPATSLSQLYASLQGTYFARERISKGAIDGVVKLLYDS